MKYKESETFLSIDPGFKRMGFAFWHKDKLEASFVKGVERKEDEPWTEYVDRGVLFFYNFFKSYIGSASLAYPLDKIIVEQVPPVSSSPTFNKSGQITLVFCAISALIIVAEEYNIPIEWVSSQEWKKTLFNDVKITKAKTRSKVLSEFPDIKKERKLGDIPFDETDSIAIGWSYIYGRTA